jgi:hypothetical protein
VVYGVPIERPLIVWAFKLLGHDIREHHFSTDREIADIASTYFISQKVSELKMPPEIGLSIYQAHKLIKK